MEAAAVNPKLIFMVGDVGWGVVEPFAEKFPTQFINAGVAEQNMMGMAAGLASEGCHVFVYSIANFPTFRCAEQIRNDVAYHNLPVTIVATGGGVGYGSMGYSHHAVQDYALMRCMPNMLIAAPCDDNEARACMRYLLANPQPSYLRLGRGGEPQRHKLVPKVEPGKWVYMGHVQGDEIGMAHVSTGTVPMEPDLPGTYYTLPLWGMDYKWLQSYQSADMEHVCTYEDHLEDGGFGSWMLESLNDWNIDVSINGLDPAVCGSVGDRDYLLKVGGL